MFFLMIPQSLLRLARACLTLICSIFSVVTWECEVFLISLERWFPESFLGARVRAGYLSPLPDGWSNLRRKCSRTVPSEIRSETIVHANKRFFQQSWQNNCYFVAASRWEQRSHNLTSVIGAEGSRCPDGTLALKKLSGNQRFRIW